MDAPHIEMKQLMSLGHNGGTKRRLQHAHAEHNGRRHFQEHGCFGRACGLKK